MLGLIVIVVVVALALLLTVGVYNRLVGLRQRANQAFADIDVQLRQRHDLVPNLVETVKGYATHERDTLESVTNARNAAVAAGDVEGKVHAENALTGALRQLFAVAEAYPDLKANQNFLSLQAELADIENKLAAARAPASSRPRASPAPSASGPASWRRARFRPTLGAGYGREECSAS